MKECWMPESIPISETVVEIRDNYGMRVCAVPADYPLSAKSWQWRILLIAAAPEMLELLSELVMKAKSAGEIWEFVHSDDELIADLGSTIAKAAQLIAKIEGGGE